jgi:hypothetical protein
VFGLVWRGWFAGLLTIFLPVWIFAMLTFALTGRWEEMLPALGGLAMMPAIAAIQGLIAGGLVSLGLRVWPPKTPREPL